MPFILYTYIYIYIYILGGTILSERFSISSSRSSAGCTLGHTIARYKFSLDKARNCCWKCRTFTSICSSGGGNRLLFLFYVLNYYIDMIILFIEIIPYIYTYTIHSVQKPVLLFRFYGNKIKAFQKIAIKFYFNNISSNISIEEIIIKTLKRQLKLNLIKMNLFVHVRIVELTQFETIRNYSIANSLSRIGS